MNIAGTEGAVAHGHVVRGDEDGAMASWADDDLAGASQRW
jgi:methyl coenzyme M reductase gamma subunit